MYPLFSLWGKCVLLQIFKEENDHVSLPNVIAQVSSCVTRVCKANTMAEVVFLVYIAQHVHTTEHNMYITMKFELGVQCSMIFLSVRDSCSQVELNCSLCEHSLISLSMQHQHIITSSQS